VQDVNWVALTVFVLLFGLITWLGFAAARWRRGDLDLLHEWGLGGRRFGTMVTWFWWAGTSIPPTPSSRCRRSRSVPGRSPSSRCRTRS
jgi:hypothetical protein